MKLLYYYILLRATDVGSYSFTVLHWFTGKMFGCDGESLMDSNFRFAFLWMNSFWMNGIG